MGEALTKVNIVESSENNVLKRAWGYPDVDPNS
jgi:hypothetical protein